MKSLLLAVLIAVAMPAYSATDNPDGGVTFTKEEGEALLANFKQMEAQIEQSKQDMMQARAIFQAMQQKIEELNKGKCT